VSGPEKVRAAVTPPHRTPNRFLDPQHTAAARPRQGLDALAYYLNLGYLTDAEIDERARRFNRFCEEFRVRPPGRAAACPHSALLGARFHACALEFAFGRRAVDHALVFDGARRVFVSQPYGWLRDSDRAEALKKTLLAEGLEARFCPLLSWHFPGSTTLIAIREARRGKTP
jgi:hypothetical protein